MRFIALIIILVIFISNNKEKVKEMTNKFLGKTDFKMPQNIVEKPSKRRRPRNPKKILLIVLVLFAIFYFLPSCIYTVDQTEYAIITTFGRPDTQPVASGLRFKLPYPIQSVTKLSKETFSTTIGYRETDDRGLEIYENEAKMITGDENIILADLEIQWKISDPIAYLYNTNNPREILYVATSSALRGVVGSSMVDDVLTDGRAEIISNIREELVRLINEYDLGITIVNVNLQDVDLPTAQVDEAFKAVTDAREERLTKINNAEKYRNEKLNEVQGERDAIISQAEAKKVAAIEKAKGDTAKFNALYNEYAKNKEVTKHRLITETINTVLKDAKVYVVDDSSGTVKYLPLETVKGVGNE